MCRDPATTVTACGDSNGQTDGSGVLDTARVGTHTYRVTVTDALGQTATRTITYTVAAQPIPPTPPTAPPPPAPARLVVRVGAPRIARAGRVVQVTVRVTNTGGSLAQAPARACTTIPAGTTATRFAGGRVTRNRVCWNLSTIRPATTRVFRLTLRASPTIRRARVITVTTTTPGRPPVRTRIRVLPAVHVPVTPRVTG